MSPPINIENYINGKFVTGDSWIDSYNPATGEVNARLPNSSGGDVQAAVEAAKEAFRSWSETPVSKRAQILNQIADKIEQNLIELAQLESEDQGKPLWQAVEIEIPRCVQNFRHFGNALNYQTETSVVEHEIGLINYTTHQAVGVVGVITPWNLPLYLLTFKLAPAIAYGNTVVAKPSELTSLTAFRLCQLLEETELPKGVINVIFGYGRSVGEAIVTHPSVELVSFTGSTTTGQTIAKLTAPFFKRLSLEMGGKNAAVVFNDIDLAEDVLKIAKSAYFNSGQICLATSRIIVHESIYDQFVQSFIQISEDFKIGQPDDPETKIGPMISKDHMAKVNKYIQMAKQSSATVTHLEPSSMVNPNGYYVGKTIIANLDDKHPCWTDEIFGPIVCIVKFKDEKKAIDLANNSIYGLSATVWTQSVDKLLRVSHRLQAGTVWANCWLVRNLNMPFGGVKQSGTGREGTNESRDFYTNQKTVCLRIKN